MGIKTKREVETNLPREQLSYFRANTKLANKLSESLKNENSIKIKHIIFGATLSFILTITSSIILLNYKQEETKELKKQYIEQSLILNQSQIDYKKLDSKIISLEKKIDSLLH